MQLASQSGSSGSVNFRVVGLVRDIGQRRTSQAIGPRRRGKQADKQVTGAEANGGGPAVEGMGHGRENFHRALYSILSSGGKKLFSWSFLFAELLLLLLLHGTSDETGSFNAPRETGSLNCASYQRLSYTQIGVRERASGS